MTILPEQHQQQKALVSTRKHDNLKLFKIRQKVKNFKNLKI